MTTFDYRSDALATDVPFSALVSDSAPLLAGECLAVGLLWLRRTRPTRTAAPAPR